MGVVYKAREVALNRVVALKMILAGAHAGDEELARFRREAEAIARLRHPGIVQVFAVGEHEGRAYFSLEFCEGGSLEKRLRDGPLPPREAAELVRALAEAVEAAHRASVVHRDLKPGNVLLATSSVGARGVSEGRRPALAHAAGSDLTPKITDFGLARRLDEQSTTQTGAIVGTPAYMAPE
jgi:serine/threonine-protein kinase